MKNLFVLLLVFFFSGKISSQTERFIYQTEVNPDTINLVNMKVENTFLDIKDNQSLFISESKLLKDSLNIVLRQQGSVVTKKSKKDKAEFPKLPNGKSIQPTFFDYFIIKQAPEKNVFLVENVGSKQVYYPEDRKMDWQITDQFAEYHNYKIQKATMSFGGRVWTAWFAPELKYANGPYKFGGLPGLILKLEDDKGDYRFSFVKKIIIANPFTESIKPDARKSTRINFRGDKESVKMEMLRNKDPEINFDNFNRMDQRNGGMNRGFGSQPNEKNEGMGAEDNASGFSNMPGGNFSGGAMGNKTLGSSNPIELNNR